MTDKEIIEIIADWVSLTKKIDRACSRFNELQNRTRLILKENALLRKRIKELENAR